MDSYEEDQEETALNAPSLIPATPSEVDPDPPSADDSPPLVLNPKRKPRTDQIVPSEEMKARKDGRKARTYNLASRRPVEQKKGQNQRFKVRESFFGFTQRPSAQKKNANCTRFHLHLPGNQSQGIFGAAPDECPVPVPPPTSESEAASSGLIGTTDDDLR
jgi:hypothetical protein